MTELEDFPFIDQTRDGDLNALYDCVPASLAAAANYLLKSNQVNDAAMKDEIYGTRYIGATAASAYVDYLKQRGLHLYAVQGLYKDLMARAHQELALGHPVIFTRDDPYSSDANMNHVCVWYKDAPGSLTCMDPFGAHAVGMTDSQWIAHLRIQEIWILEKAMLDVIDVKGFFQAESDTAWRCKNGQLLIGGMLNFFRRMPNPLAVIGLPRTGEISVEGHPGVKIQVFERIILCYDPGHVLDRPPGADDVYALHLDSLTSPGVTQLIKVLGISGSGQDLSAVRAGLENIEQTAQTTLAKIK